MLVPENVLLLYTSVKMFSIVGAHIKPKAVFQELDEMINVHEDIRTRWGHDIPVIFMGDFNADGRYYLIGQKNVGLIFRLTKLFVGQNFRHLQRILSLLSNERFSTKFVFVTHYVYKCISIKHLGKNLIRQNISSDKIFVRHNFRHFVTLVVIFLSDKVTLKTLYYTKRG